MKNDMVSVIIPVYNVKPYLDRCMQSVINQTYRNLEILLINDGSTDGSAEKCRQWKAKDDRILFISKENEGLGPTRNLGVKRANGEYVIFIDSDDWWELDTVEKLYSAAMKNNADIVYMNFYFSYNDENGKLKNDMFIRHYLFDGAINPADRPEVIFDQDARMWSKMFRRRLFTDENIYMPAHSFEDFPVMPLLTLASRRVCQVHECLYHYFYKRQDNIVGNVSSYQYINAGIRELYNEFVKRGYEPKYRKPLKIYLYDMCKFALNDLPAKKLSREEYGEYEKPFLTTITDLIPEKINNMKCKVVIWGSYSNRLIVYNLLTKQNQIIEHYMFCSMISLLGDRGKNETDILDSAPLNLFRRGMLEKELEHKLLEDKEKLGSADYFFIDLLEEINGVIHIKNSYITDSEAFQEQMYITGSEGKKVEIDSDLFLSLWKQASDMFVEFLYKYGLIKKVVLIKLFLSEYYGVAMDRKEKFATWEKIRKINQILDMMYEYFEKKAGNNIQVVTVNEFENYTYKYTKYGCVPTYFNGKYHRAVADKIEDALWRIENEK